MMGKRQLVAKIVYFAFMVPRDCGGSFVAIDFFCFCYSHCKNLVVWLFLAVPWVCLPLVIVVFPDHTHLLVFSRLKLNQ